MKDGLEKSIANLVSELFGVDCQIELTRPDEQFGDFSTNIALQLTKQIGQNPREIADQLAAKLRESGNLSEVTVAGPGFINLKLTDDELVKSLDLAPEKSLAGQVIVAEYSDPNPFKVLHAGHLYTSLVGDTVSRLMEAGGAKVHRVNFGGDVGLHVGRTMWAIIRELGGENPDKLEQVPDDQKLDWVSRHYVAGTQAYETDDKAKAEIIDLNQKIYDLHKNNDHNSPFAQIYWTCRQWSYDGFDDLYSQLHMLPFEKYYPESSVSDRGLKTVRQHVGDVYEQSEGAIIFRGEPYNLFTQVFINKAGLPTYAGKDVGLIFQKHDDFAPNQSFIFTDVAQKDHLAVVMKSISLFAPDLVQATRHYTHGQIKMAGGVKMSSRKGTFLRADDILEAAREASKKLSRESDYYVVVGAVRYSFLKNRIGGDMVYDPEESVSIEGNSGPYLQYAHARARSILSKAQAAVEMLPTELQSGERALVRKIGEYTEVVNRAVNELMPHHICTYLYELAQTFNRFYENNRVIGDERQALRLVLVERYADTLRDGLGLLGIASPDKM